jgi:hypothetical protein
MDTLAEVLTLYTTNIGLALEFVTGIVSASFIPVLVAGAAWYAVGKVRSFMFGR